MYSKEEKEGETVNGKNKCNENTTQRLKNTRRQEEEEEILSKILNSNANLIFHKLFYEDYNHNLIISLLSS